MVLPQNLVDVINVLGNAKLFVEVADLDGWKLFLDPRVEAEDVLFNEVDSFYYILKFEQILFL